MGKMNIESQIEELVKPIITNLKYTLYDVQYQKEGKDYYLRITIDKPEGISIQDCQNVNDAINDILDEADYIKDSYFLEVSSPGIERVLRKQWHFEKQIGNMIFVKLFQTIEKKKEFQGILENYSENEICLKVDDKIINLDRTNIAMAKTVVEEF